MKLESPKSWDAYFIDIMKATAARSKDPNTKVGAVIVDSDNKIVGMGYNGFPPGIADTEARWKHHDVEANTKEKYKYVVHAEMNAIFNSFKPVTGCKIYVPFWPCESCAKHIIAAGINEVIILDKDYYFTEFARDLFWEAKVDRRWPIL